MYVGIDVGKNGALAIIHSSDNSTEVYDFESKDDIIDFIKYNALDIKMLCMEKVHAMPNQGVTSMFSFGENFGWWKGLLEAYSVPYDLVRPQEWMKGNVPAKPSKKDIYDVAKRLYPNAKLEGIKGGIKDGRSDALMIAHYCRKTYR